MVETYLYTTQRNDNQYYIQNEYNNKENENEPKLKPSFFDKAKFHDVAQKTNNDP